MRREELGGWRRTHLSSEISPELSGGEVTLMGWISNMRDLGGITFAVLQDVSGEIQITAPKGEISDDVFEKLASIDKGSAVGVRGKVKAVEQAPRGVEVIPSEIRILSPAKPPPPLDPSGKVKADLDTRIDARLLDLRRPSSRATFKIEHEASQAIREYFSSRGFIEVHTPKIISSATESGTSLFLISYFAYERAFLGQSPQLYKEVLTRCFDKVFEVGPIFRAEEHDTSYHLCEVISVDAEMAFCDENDAMDTLEELVVDVFGKVKESAGTSSRPSIGSLKCRRNPSQG